MFDLDFLPNQYWHCALSMTFAFTAIMCSTLFTMSMTFERFYSIIRPHKAASFNTFKRAKINILIKVIFGIAYNTPHFFITIFKGRVCVPYAKGKQFVYGQMYYWVSFVLNFAFPFLSLLVINSVIIHTLRNRSRFGLRIDQGQGQGQGQGKGQGQDGKLKNSEKQIYLTLLLITFGFLVLSTPSYAFNISQLIYNYNKSPYSYSGFHLFFQVARNVHYTNCGVNFFLYVMSGHKCRNDLIRLFRFKRDKTSNGSTLGSTTNMSMMSASVTDK